MVEDGSAGHIDAQWPSVLTQFLQICANRRHQAWPCHGQRSALNRMLSMQGRVETWAALHAHAFRFQVAVASRAVGKVKQKDEEAHVILAKLDRFCLNLPTPLKLEKGSANSQLGS